MNYEGFVDKIALLKKGKDQNTRLKIIIQFLVERKKS